MVISNEQGERVSIPQVYHEWILWIGDGTGLPDAILHIHAGLAIMVLVRLLSRRSLGSFIPFGVVLLAELLNELLDCLHYGLRWNDTIADVGNTLFWPFVISLGVRLRPLLAPAPASARTRDEDDHRIAEDIGPRAQARGRKSANVLTSRMAQLGSPHRGGSTPNNGFR